MFSLWQAHLSFVLLGFVALCALRFTAPWRPWLLPVLVAVSFIPVNALPLAAYVRSFTDDLAISTLVLLAWVGLCRLGLATSVSRRHQVQMVLLFGLLSLVLYPATLGLTYFDPYRWGFNPRPMIVLVAAAALLMLWLRNAVAVWMLAIGTLAFALRLAHAVIEIAQKALLQRQAPRTAGGAKAFADDRFVGFGGERLAERVG